MDRYKLLADGSSEHQGPVGTARGVGVDVHPGLLCHGHLVISLTKHHSLPLAADLQQQETHIS